MYLWLTDPHFDFCEGRVKIFGEYLANDYPDAKGMIITGDISNGKFIDQHLQELVEGFGKQIYFTLGNHDIYHESFDGVWRKIRAMNNPLLTYLDDGNIDIGNDITLVGTSNWYDCRFGNVKTSWIELNDYNFIKDFQPNMRNREQQVDLAQNRADLQARKFKERLNQVTTKKVIVAMHVAPFAGATWHQGKLSDQGWMPWMSSKVTGEVLIDFHEANPDKDIFVICGHTHSSGVYKVADNLIVYTGKARYGLPKETGVVLLDSFTVKVATTHGYEDLSS